MANFVMKNKVCVLLVLLQNTKRRWKSFLRKGNLLKFVIVKSKILTKVLLKGATEMFSSEMEFQQTEAVEITLGEFDGTEPFTM